MLVVELYTIVLLKTNCFGFFEAFFSALPVSGKWLSNGISSASSSAAVLCFQHRLLNMLVARRRSDKFLNSAFLYWLR